MKNEILRLSWKDEASELVFRPSEAPGGGLKENQNPSTFKD